MFDKRELRAREEAVATFAKLHPDYVKLEDHPDKRVIAWAYDKGYSFPVVVAGVEFVAPGTAEIAKMWWEKEGTK